MKKLGQITGIFLILTSLYWVLQGFGVIDDVLSGNAYAFFNLVYVLLGVFIFLLSSKLK